MKNIENIMIVDDDLIVHFITEKTLACYNPAFNSYSVKNGKEAICLLEKHTEDKVPMPDLIILDLHMPIMDGIAFMEKFKQSNFEHKKIIVAVFTSCENKKERERLLELGVDYIFSKPISIEKLMDIVS